MAHVSPTQVSPGDEITADSVNVPINQIAAQINGNLDDTNIAGISGTKLADSTVLGSKLADGAVTPEKQTVRACLASRSFTLANASTITVGLNTTSYDPEEWLSGSEIVVPDKGLYEIGGYALFAASGGGDLRMIYLYVNGSNAREFRNSQAFDASYAHSVEGSIKIVLNAGDKVELRCFQNSGGSLSVEASLQVEFLGSVVDE